MVGYQHMYTSVYKCLTAHGTIIHTEQVSWDMEAPLGIFPGSGESKPAAPQEAPTVIPSDLWRQSSPATPASRGVSQRPSKPAHRRLV